MKKYKPILGDYKSEYEDFNGYSISCYDKNYDLLNFSPGPASIPKKVFNKLYFEIFNNEKYVLGNTPLEMSHRSPEFNTILENVNNKLRKFMKIPNEFKIIWTQGGGHGQFSAIPLNFTRLKENVKGGYFVNGTWSNRAYNESKKYIDSINLCNNYYLNTNQKEVMEYNSLPYVTSIPDDIDYVYLCSNETVNGLEFSNGNVPYPSRNELGNTKIVIDMSSDFLMKKIDWENLDVAFACTSKNMGIAGASVLIIRENLLNELQLERNIPYILDWNLYYKTNSLFNTPAIFNIYLLEHILDSYISDFENIENMNKNTLDKSKLVYEFLDNNNKFKPVVLDLRSRSNINIPFIVDNGNEETMIKFLEYCYQNNIVGLRTKTPFNYKDLGMIEPLRVSLYNGISLKDTKHLIKVMSEFIKLI